MKYTYDHIGAKDAPSLLERLNVLGQQGWRVVGWSYDRHDATSHNALIERAVEQQAVAPPSKKK